MEKAYLIGIDIGTSSVKTVVTDYRGRRLAQHCHTYATSQPLPGYVEQDPDETWWTGAREGIRVCLEQSGIPAAAVAGVCASGMVPNLCPLDGQGRPVRPAILYRDNRAVEQATRLRARFGWNFSLQDVTPKLLWIKENEPECYEKIEMVLNAHSYIAYKLTGQYSADHDIAAIFGEVYDEQARVWLPERMQAIGLDPKVLPPLCWPTNLVGGVTQEAAAQTGLLAGTPVVAGTGDSYTILVGTGTVDAGEGLIYLGTAGTFLGLSDSLDHMRGTCPFITGGARFLGNVLTGGEITRWFRESLVDGRADYTQLEEQAACIPPGAEGLYALPHLLGERTPVADPLARGVLFGLTTAHGMGHVYRAFLEGVAYALRDSYEHNPLPLSRVVISGGGGNCALWRQIIADVLGRPLTSISNGDNALGTCYLAAMALGMFDSFRTVRDEWLSGARTITPNPEHQAVYDRYFPFYQQLNALVRPAYQGLQALEGREDKS